jgi:hypothetical protein
MRMSQLISFLRVLCMVAYILYMYYITCTKYKLLRMSEGHYIFSLLIAHIKKL